MRSLKAMIAIMGFLVLSISVVSYSITFTDITRRANLDGYPNCRASAWLDYNRDGYLDLLVGSENGANRLHRNLGNGTFENVTGEARIPTRPGVWGVNFADIDNDGYQEIYLSTRAPDTFSAGRNILLYNTGFGSFDDISDLSGTNVYGGGIAACFAPFNKGPYIDLFVPNQYYPDMEYPFFLYNTGGGLFSDVTDDVGLHILDWWDEPIAFDYDNDFDLELFCTKDYHGNSMYDQLYGSEFVEVSENLFFQTPCGYGASVGDINNDGWFDLYITNWHYYNDNLFVFDSSLCRYYDMTQDWGCNGGPWTSAAHFADFDDDGWLDLFITGAGTGNIYYHNESGHHFSDQTSQSGLMNYGYNWGASIADFDNDGFLDIFTPEYYGGSGGRLYHNNGNNNNWVKFELEGINFNRDAIGARLLLQTSSNSQVREITGGSGFGSQNSLVQHFGLGQDSIISRLIVYWLGRGYDIYDSLATNTTYHIVQGEGLSIGGVPIKIPSEFNITKVYPNPFNGIAQIDIHMGRICDLTVDIIDVLGRRIKILREGEIRESSLSLNWDGKDQSGRTVSSGIYFCRAANDHRQEVKKITLLK